MFDIIIFVQYFLVFTFDKNTIMLESDILYTAVDNLKKQTGVNIEVGNKEIKDGNQRWDALLSIYFGKFKHEFKVEIKNQVHRSNLPRIFSLLNFKNLLVAQYISQPSKALLEEKGINYLDSAGNCFIKNEVGLFWKINHLKNEVVEIPKPQLELHKNGIKLVFVLLIDNNLINEPYRVQAIKAGISLGTVGKIHKDLANAKFIYQLNKKEKLLANKTKLLALWVQAYNQKLKPKLFRGKYRFANEINSMNWRQIRMDDRMYWGGEPAANALTNYLQPEILMLYTNLDRSKLMKELKVFPSTNGNLRINSVFWNTEEDIFTHKKLSTVHPLLVYADLVGSANQRNIDTSKKVYEQYLKSILE